jgi:hypothetical protein
MSESEWLTCADPRKMLAFLHGKANNRRLRLFACACCRRMGRWLVEERSRAAVEVAERYADDEADERELYEASVLAENAAEMFMVSAVTAVDEAFASAAFAAFRATLHGDDIADYASSNANSAAFHAAIAENLPSAAPVHAAESLQQTCLLRDIFGNPFRSIAIPSAWFDGNDAAVVRLAQTAYEERSLPAGTFDNTRLLILADALEETGCTDRQILTHLRGGGEHYRGCWVVDLLLGKA